MILKFVTKHGLKVYGPPTPKRRRPISIAVTLAARLLLLTELMTVKGRSPEYSANRRRQNRAALEASLVTLSGQARAAEVHKA